MKSDRRAVVLFVTSLLVAPVLVFAKDEVEARQVGPFKSIDLQGAADMKVRRGSALQLSVHGDKEAVAAVQTEVKNGRLLVSTRGIFVGPGTPTVIVTVPTLDQFILSGAGDVDVDDLVADDFTAELRGSGDIHLAGAVKRLKLNLSGAGNIEAERFGFGDGSVMLDGTGDIKLKGINAEKLTIELSGSGDIEAAGVSKQLSAKLDGSGSISARELSAREAKLDLGGSGDLVVTVTDKVTADLRGSGDIVIYGQPKDRTLNIKGSGDVGFR